MKNQDTPLSPPMLLAIAYAPVPVRARLAWLLMLDQRLSAVLNRASEPMIVQLRLSWWRDALKSELDKRPKGEPLLAELNKFGPDDAIIPAGLALVDAFEILATSADLQEQKHARKQRASAICKAYNIWSGCTDTDELRVDPMISWWADPIGSLPVSLPRLLRPLSILALAEQLEASQSRPSPLCLSWHALTGR